MKKKTLMMIALLCIMAQYARADKWDGITYEEPTLEWRRYYISSPEFMDDGVATSRMMKSLIIHNAAQMAYVRKSFCHEKTIGSETVDISSVILCLEADIDMGDWEPLGAYDYYGTTSSTPFTGTFYGNGHTIRINIKDAEANYQGLFLRIGENGTVRDLHVAGNIQCSDSRLVGGIAGENDGTINNCWVSADVSSDWQSSASAFDAKVGGIAGENSGTISYCCVTGNVKNNDSDVGGIVGCNNKSGVVDNCTFYGTRSSTHAQDNEYIGDNSGTMTNMHNSFTDSELAEYINIVNDQKLLEYFNRFGYHPGWFLRFLYCDAVQHPFTVTVNNESEGSLAADVATARPGQSVKLTPSAGNSIVKITVRDADKNLQNEWFSPLAESLSFDMPRRDVTVTTTNTTWTGSGTADDPYLIPTTEAWERIHTTLMSSATENAFENTYFKQTADIDITQGIGATGNANTKKFCGIYDGDSHRMNCMLTNPVENSVEAVAPFHDLKNATIKNLSITGSINGGIHSAGITAHTRGTVTIDNCRVSADIICGGSNGADAHGGGFIGHAEDSQVKITKSLFDGSLTAKSNGKGDIRLAAFSGWAGSKIDIQYCAENGKYDGTTANDQTAYCWKDNGNTTPDYDHLNMFISDLGHHNGADKALLVTSGTEDLELVFPDNCYDWQVVYQGAMFRSIDEYAVSYIVGGKFYTILNSVVRFDISYPVNWKNVTVYNGGQKLSYVSGHYNFKQSDKNTVITCEHGIANWIDENVAASKFSTVDESTKTVTIKNAEELALLSKQVYNGENDGEGWTYLLDADLEMSLYEWTPIGTVKDNVPTHYFMGTFDGQGHTISGINVTTNGEHFGSAGLFGCVMAGTVKNVKLFNSQIDGYYYVGGITGYQGNANIENCYVGNNVKLNPLGADASTGGISGVVLGSGSLKGCYSAACISKNEGAQYSYEEINVGGIAGNVNGPAVVTGNVSQAMIMSGTSTQHFRGYVLGSKPYSTATNNYYIASKPSDNSYDVRAFCVTLSEFLEDDGFKMTYQADNTSYDVSGIQMYNGQFLMGDEWYVPANGTFHFSLPERNDMFSRIVWSDVKINDGDVLKPVDGVYSFNITDDTNMEFEVNASYFGTINPPTDITPATTQSTLDDAWYDLNGRKLSGKPTQKGVYIYNGKKVVIK